MLVRLDKRSNYGEARWIGIGLLRQRTVVVIYTEPSDNTACIISLRKALTHERRRYERYLEDRLE